MSEKSETRLKVEAILKPRFAPGWGRYLDVGDGWLDFIYDLAVELERESPDYVLHQVKEKFGGLRFYVSNYTERGKELVQEAEALSYVICENDGVEGASLVKVSGWYRTLCDKCATEQGAKPEPECTCCGNPSCFDCEGCLDCPA